MVEKFWIKFRIWIRLLFNRKKKIRKEMIAVRRFIEENKISQTFNIMNYLKYLPDEIDWQKLAYETIKDGGGDCEDIHRVVQIIVYLLTHNKEVYLIHAITNPKKYSHAFVIYKKNKDWYAINYGTQIKGKTKEDVIRKTLMKRLVWYYATDLNWKRAFKVGL